MGAGKNLNWKSGPLCRASLSMWRSSSLNCSSNTTLILALRRQPEDDEAWKRRKRNPRNQQEEETMRRFMVHLVTEIDFVDGDEASRRGGAELPEASQGDYSERGPAIAPHNQGRPRRKRLGRRN